MPLSQGTVHFAAFDDLVVTHSKAICGAIFFATFAKETVICVSVL